MLAEQLYLFIQTPLATGVACLAWSLYIVRTSIIAKNRHPNIVLQVELYLRTGTYDRPKNTLAIDSARAPLDSALAMRPAHFTSFNRFESRMDDITVRGKVC